MISLVPGREIPSLVTAPSRPRSEGIREDPTGTSFPHLVRLSSTFWKESLRWKSKQRCPSENDR